MPRPMPKYASSLGKRVTEAIAIAQAGDLVLATSQIESPLRDAWSVNRVELLYEFSYVRFFFELERFLEEPFVRYLCGYQSGHGVCQPVRGSSYYGRLSTAQGAILGSRNFTLWHDPAKVVARSKRFFNQGFHELVIASNNARL